jgi:hypothetical protein
MFHVSVLCFKTLSLEETHHLLMQKHASGPLHLPMSAFCALCLTWCKHTAFHLELGALQVAAHTEVRRNASATIINSLASSDAAAAATIVTHITLRMGPATFCTCVHTVGHQLRVTAIRMKLTFTYSAGSCSFGDDIMMEFTAASCHCCMLLPENINLYTVMTWQTSSSRHGSERIRQSVAAQHCRQLMIGLRIDVLRCCPKYSCGRCGG